LKTTLLLFLVGKYQKVKMKDMMKDQVSTNPQLCVGSDITGFRTHDFYPACILHAAGIPLNRLEHGEGRRVIFVFDDKNFEAENLIEQHWSGELRQRTKDLIRSIHELKQVMFSKSGRSK